MVKFKDLHVTQPIAPKAFEAGCLRLEAYSPEDISNAIVDNVCRLAIDGEMTARQRGALLRSKYQGSCKSVWEQSP
jgi:hypothetical protein